jgi:hypothetical protein
MKTVLRILAASLLAGAATQVVADNLVRDGGFESPEIAPGWAQCFSNSSLGEWTSDGSPGSCLMSTDYQSTVVWPGAQEGEQYMYLGNVLAANVTLSQWVPLVAGQHYSLSFHLAGLDPLPGGSLEVGIAGQASALFAVPSNSVDWQAHGLSFTATAGGDQLLYFVSPTGGAINIDNVSLLATPVPEPAPALALAVGLLGLALRRGERRH